MKAGFTASELAAMGLPGLPGTKQGVNAKAAREGWAVAGREGRGGASLYSINTLPEESRLALIARQAAGETADEPAPANDTEPSAERLVEGASEVLWRTYDRLPAKSKQRAQSKLKAVAAVAILRDSGASAMDAYRTVAAEQGVARESLRRWCRAVQGAKRENWLPLLADSYSGRPPSQGYSEEAYQVFKADWLRPSKPAAEACYRRLQEVAAGQGWTVPTLRVLTGRLQREVARERQILAREGRKALARVYPAQERDRSHLYAMAALTGDGHKLDVFADRDGRTLRPMLVAWQDLYSGRIVGWRLAETEDSNTVRLAFADVVKRVGIPERLYLDNGRAFAAKGLTGGAANRHRFKIKEDDPEGLFTALGTEVHFVKPYSGQSKPIERAFRDLAERISKHPACDAAYCGNKPSARPEDVRKPIDFDALVDLVRAEVARHNAQAGRRAANCKGRSFDETFAESYAAHPPRRASEQQLAMVLLQAEGLRVDRREASIRVMGTRYGDLALGGHLGERVIVRFDPEDLAKPLFVYTLDNRFIARAEPIEAVAFDDVGQAKDHERTRRQYQKAIRETDRLDRALTAADIARLQPAGQAEPGFEQHSKVVRAAFGLPSKADPEPVDSAPEAASFAAAMDRFRSGMSGA